MFKNMKIKTKLSLLIAFPLILLFVASQEAFMSNYKIYQTLDKLHSGVELSTKLSLLVHETQKERGATAGFIGSGGKKFGSTLKSQRELTNKRLQELKVFVKTHDFSVVNSELYSTLNKTLESLSRLDNIRLQVDNLSIKLGGALSYYTKTNKYIIDTISNVLKSSEDKDITKQLSAYSNFLLSKERAGIERAVGAVVLNNNKFTSALKTKFVSLLSAQDSYMANYLVFASSKSKAFYEQTMQGNDIDEVNRIRKLLLSQDDNFGVDGNYWFKMITGKINKLKQVDDYLANEVLNTINSKLSAVKNKIIFFGSSNLLSVLLVVLLAMYLMKDVFKKVRNLDSAVENLLTSKDISSRIEVLADDEIGKISKNFNSYLQSIEDGIKEDEKVIADAYEVMNRVKHGWYSQYIQTSTSNQMLNNFKDGVNEMIKATKEHFSNVNVILEQYTHLDYREKLHLDNIEKGGVFEVLVNDINNLRDTITNSLATNKQNGVTLKNSATELLVNVDKLNIASNEAAASLEETAAAIEQITANITNTTQSVINMAGYANDLKEASTTGANLANETTTAMEEIDDKVTAINEAITVIDQIAFQTNILSLNAAVEAATAGEAGKGFAVVAGEVRNLAARSAEAANEIKTLVENALAKANNGKIIATDMIKGYNTLNSDIEKTIDLIQSVETASKEQQSAIAQINDAVSSLDQQTQENASVASNTHTIATNTQSIAIDIVNEVDKSKFVGQDDIKVNTITTTQSNNVASNFAQAKSKPAKQEVITSDSNNDEWESF
jgi:methyl-accepting chemotaxis protein